MRFLLYPFSVLYGITVGIRNLLFDYNFLQSKEFDIPVIGVGNITVGGTGKTPHVEYLIQLLKEKYNVAVLSRGYKRKTKGFLEVQHSMNSFKAGDEPLQMKKKFQDVKIVVDEKRVRGIKKILMQDNEYHAQVILLDDAFQHRHVKPGISILVIDYNRPIITDSLLPYGRLRESLYQKKRADIIIISKCPENMTPISRRILYKDLKTYAYQNLFFTSMQYADLKHINENKSIKLDSEKLKYSSVLLITGIASPKILVEFLKPRVSEIIHKKYPDHYQFKEKDVVKMKSEFEKMAGENKIIITTEKDAIRFRNIIQVDELEDLPLYYIPVKVNFLNKDSENFDKIIMGYIYKNKRKQNN